MKKLYILFAFFCLVLNSFAVNRFWVGGASGNWNTTASWSATSGGASGASVPGANDAVFFDNGLTVAVSYNAASNDLGLAGFSVLNNTTLTLTNTVNTTRSITINSVSSTYYEVVAAGSALELRSNTNSVFNFGSSTLSSGRMVFNGAVRCVNQAVNTSNGPRLNSQDSMIINNLFYVGPMITQTGSNPTGLNKFRFSNGSVYQLDKNGGTIPGGKYEPLSLIKITGTTTAFPAVWGTAAAYGSIEFDSPSASSVSVGNLVLPANTIFQGDFTIINLGTSAGIRFGATPTVTIQGNLNQNNGILSLASSGAAGTVTVNGGFNQAAGTTLDLQNSSGATNLSIKGNINSLGTITENGSGTVSTVNINGTVQQTLNFVTITNDVRFNINNPAGGLLSNDWNMPNSSNSRITLTNGNINLGVNTLYLANGLTTALVGGTSSSHIIGELRRAMTTIGGTYAFPVSDNTTDIATVNIFPVAAGDYTVKFFRPNPFDRDAVPAPVLNAGDYYWDIAQNAGSGANLNFTYGGFDNGGITDPNSVRGLHWNGTSWDNLGGSDAGGSSVTVTGVTDFGPFTLGTVVVLLPVTIEYFKGTKIGETNRFDWKVSCTNTPNVTMTLERSADGARFNTIQTISATAVRCQQPFDKLDATPLPGTNYYRLKVTDADGKVSYSTTVTLLNKQQPFEILSMMPNPVKSDGATVLNVNNAQKISAELVVTDVSGKQLFTQTIQLTSGNNRIPVNFSRLAAGSYQLTLRTIAADKNTIRFVKQ